MPNNTDVIKLLTKYVPGTNSTMYDCGPEDDPERAYYLAKDVDQIIASADEMAEALNNESNEREAENVGLQGANEALERRVAEAERWYRCFRAEIAGLRKALDEARPDVGWRQAVKEASDAVS